MRKKVTGVYDKGDSGSVLEAQQDLVDTETEEVYAQIHVWSFYVGQGNWGGPRGPAMQDFSPPSDRGPDVVVAHQTTPETPLLYRSVMHSCSNLHANLTQLKRISPTSWIADNVFFRLNGDYNPLHATPEPGAAMGFGGVILHGLIAWNITCHAIVRELCGSDSRNIREFQARFAAPVIPGDKLIMEIWRTNIVQDGREEVRFVTRVEGGKPCLKSGRALIRSEPRLSGAITSTAAPGTAAHHSKL
jgi:peroxisomal enoyl-CoA hydratase 2